MHIDLHQALVLSTLGLFAGPILVALGRGKALAAALIDGLTLGIFPLVLILKILPHAAEMLGMSAVWLALAGFGALMLADRHGHAGDRVGRSLIVPALALHALADGVSLAAVLHSASGDGATQAQGLFVWALLLHRLPEGLFVFTTLRTGRRPWSALAAVAALATATIAGALLGGRLLLLLPAGVCNGVIAFGVGAMLRMVVHSHSAAPGQRASEKAIAGIGLVVGAACALLLPSPHDLLRSAQPRELSVTQSLAPLFVETAPSLLLGLTASGLLHTFGPRKMIPWLSGGSPARQAARGMVFGLPLPICSCGVAPLVRRLLLQGAPVAAVVAFAIGTPELGVDSAFLSWRLLGAPLTLVRVATSAVTALVVALIVARVTGHGAPAPRPTLSLYVPPAAAPALRERARTALREAFVHSPEHVTAWYAIGLLLAAIFEAAVTPHAFAHLGSPWDVLVVMVLALPVYVCAQGATPLAAVMLHKGFSVGAVMTFLIVGPGVNVAVVGLLRRMLGRPAALAFVAGILACALVVGLGAGRLVPAVDVPRLHSLASHQHSRFEWLCALILAAIMLASLLRAGPRGWFATLAASDEEPREGHRARATAS